MKLLYIPEQTLKTVYAIRNDKCGYPLFLVYLANRWQWISAKHFKED